MEKIFEQSLLYDYYGELLTERQQRIYQSVVFEDYSESEIARDEGISRQGVHDMIRRCNQALEMYESKLHLVERFLKIKSEVLEIRRLADIPAEENIENRLKEIDGIAAAILEEL